MIRTAIIGYGRNGSTMHANPLERYTDDFQIVAVCDIDPEAQMARILIRNGEESAKMFRTRWIPMEEKYFGAFSIREKADIRI